MTVPELKSPIRLYWDLDPHRDISEICRQIVACRFLALDLTETVPRTDNSCGLALSFLARAPLAITLTVAPANPGQLPDLPPFRPNLKQLLFQCASLDELRKSSLPSGNVLNGVPVGISFPVTGETACDLPGVVRFCVEGGVKRLVLPMQRLTNGEEPYSLTRGERAALAGELSSIGRLETLSVVVHDPFLWRAFFPEKEFPEGRCQAANTMLFLAADGTVYPCPSMPEPLGNLAEESLAEIVSGNRKCEVRSAIRELPAVCRCCPEMAGCGGGCRGRGHAAGGSLAAADYGCR